jgi:hypothetical protein
VLGELRRRSRTRYVPPFARALVSLGLGEREATLEALERAVEERDVRLTFLAVEPRWDPLRSHARFRKVYERVGLPETTRVS